MKILLIHGDETPWATLIRCQELKKRWTEDDVDIYNYHHLPEDLSVYDIIHVMFSGGIGYLKNVAVEYKNKFYTSLASQRTLDLVYDNAQNLKTVYENSKKIVCQNPKLMENLLHLIDNKYKDNLVYIPNGVDENIFNRKFVVGFVANDQASNPEHKGYDLVKQACDELHLELKDLHNTYFKEPVPHDKMPDFYNQIDCLVIPSISEGCNNPTLEALAMNKPVISTRCGIAEHLDGVTLVERNVDSIKGALRKLSGRIQILENYTWDIIAKKYRELYVE